MRFSLDFPWLLNMLSWSFLCGWSPFIHSVVAANNFSRVSVFLSVGAGLKKFWMTSQFRCAKHSASYFAACRTCWKVQALSFCRVLRCLSDVLEGPSFIAVWSVSNFFMLLKNFVGVIYQSLRKVCATSGPCTSTRTCFVLNGSRCLIELTRCGRKSNQPSSVAWPLCQPTRCGRKRNQPSSVAWWPLCQPTRCGRSNAAWWMFPLHVICYVLVYNYDLQTQSK